ncbi:MAG: energy transducer TonB [Bacteroidales bacterium]|nr:energy transducer TonB [Bacteroidales bacterium]
MDLKKSKTANLEKKIGVNIFLGLVISLSLILISFEWTTLSTVLSHVYLATEIQFEEEMIQITPREEPKQESKPELPKIKKVIIMVDNDIELDEDYLFDTEATSDTRYIFTSFPDDDPEKIDKEEDHFNVEIMPTFNGGDPSIEFCKFILENLRYPESAVENGVKGRVIVKFVVSRTGSLERAEVIRSVHPTLDQEALRVIMSSPKWSPGVQSGRTVNVIYVFPINFVLQ